MQWIIWATAVVAMILTALLVILFIILKRKKDSDVHGSPSDSLIIHMENDQQHNGMIVSETDKSGSWICRFCETVNEHTRKKCIACGKEKV